MRKIYLFWGSFTSLLNIQPSGVRLARSESRRTRPAYVISSLPRSQSGSGIVCRFWHQSTKRTFFFPLFALFASLFSALNELCFAIHSLHGFRQLQLCVLFTPPASAASAQSSLVEAASLNATRERGWLTLGETWHNKNRRGCETKHVTRLETSY